MEIILLVSRSRAMDLKIGKDWFTSRDWKPFPFQLDAWSAYLNGNNGLVNAPTGSGKTYSLLIPVLLEFIRNYPDFKSRTNNGLQVIWITPIRALSKEIELSASRAISGLGIPWRVGVRSGDTSLKERARQKERPAGIADHHPRKLAPVARAEGLSCLL